MTTLTQVPNALYSTIIAYEGTVCGVMRAMCDGTPDTETGQGGRNCNVRWRRIFSQDLACVRCCVIPTWTTPPAPYGFSVRFMGLREIIGGKGAAINNPRRRRQSSSHTLAITWLRGCCQGRLCAARHFYDNPRCTARSSTAGREACRRTINNLEQQHRFPWNCDITGAAS